MAEEKKIKKKDKKIAEDTAAVVEETKVKVKKDKSEKKSKKTEVEDDVAVETKEKKSKKRKSEETSDEAASPAKPSKSSKKAKKSDEDEDSKSASIKTKKEKSSKSANGSDISSEDVAMNDSENISSHVSESEEDDSATPEVPAELRFETHNLSESTKSALINSGRTSLFPIQAACFAKVMAGKDLLGRARTGTGKTLAFTLPMVETLKKQKAESKSGEFFKRGRAPSALIMAPTRELANQVFKEFETVANGELQLVCVYGGSPYETQSK
jgi:ATP-dependent RNA helicase DDX21